MATFLRPDEIGDVTTVFYVKQDETINIDNGCFEFYEDLKEDPLWFQKPILEQRADVERLASQKLAQINAGIVPLMPDMPPPVQPDVQIRDVNVSGQ